MSCAFLFPGQGSQAVGMGRSLWETFPASKEVFEEVDEALNENLSRIIFEGPLDLLTQTRYAQPALMAVSLAAVRALEEESKKSLNEMVQVVAGHSLGEYSALTAAGSLTLADAARLLRLRGQAMEEAMTCTYDQGTMAAILGLSIEQVESIVDEAAQGNICTIANDNCPGQVVISGHTTAIERACVLAKTQGAKRCILLNVSAPFHCPLMEPAAQSLIKPIQAITFSPLRIPLIPNITAQWENFLSEDAIRHNLIKQIPGRVRWRETCETLKTFSVTLCVESGPGNILTQLARRTLPDAMILPLETPQNLDSVLKAIN